MFALLLPKFWGVLSYKTQFEWLTFSSSIHSVADNAHGNTNKQQLSSGSWLNDLTRMKPLHISKVAEWQLRLTINWANVDLRVIEEYRYIHE